MKNVNWAVILSVLLLSMSLGTANAALQSKSSPTSMITSLPDLPSSVLLNESESDTENRICVVKTQYGERTGVLIDLNIQPGWNMIGYPGVLGDTGDVDAYCEDVCGYCDVSEYPHFKYDTSIRSYTVEPSPKLNTGYFMFNPGRISPNNDWYCCVEEEDAEIYLSPGWNMITNPCCRNLSFVDLFGEGVITGNKGLWYNPRTSAFEDSEYAVPGRAYWVYYTGDREKSVSVKCRRLLPTPTHDSEVIKMMNYGYELGYNIALDKVKQRYADQLRKMGLSETEIERRINNDITRIFPLHFSTKDTEYVGVCASFTYATNIIYHTCSVTEVKQGVNVNNISNPEEYLPDGLFDSSNDDIGGWEKTKSERPPAWDEAIHCCANCRAPFKLCKCCAQVVVWEIMYGDEFWNRE